MTKAELWVNVVACKRAISYVVDLMDAALAAKAPAEFDRLEAVMLRLCNRHDHFHCAWRNAQV